MDKAAVRRLAIGVFGREIEIDSRPSDAIALGVAEDVPIFVAEHVLARTQSGQELEEDYEETGAVVDAPEEGS